MRSSEFWTFFETTAMPRLGLRAATLEMIFGYLDRIDRAVGIVETGCVRAADMWERDGCSTVLFDKYAQTHPGSAVYTVDIDPKATALCQSLVSDRVRIATGDSVAFLRRLADAPPPDLPFLDLLYLDSYDLDWDNIFPSAMHHLKELLAVSPLISAETLVVIDDSPTCFFGVITRDGVRPVKQATPGIGGKGKYIADYASQVGAELQFASYQCGFTKLRAAKRSSLTPESSR